LRDRTANRAALATVLFFGIFFAYTLPFGDWRLFDDDYVVLRAAQSAKTLSDVGDFFSSNPNNRTLYPSNYRDDVELTFFNVMYRPFTQLLHTIEVFFFSAPSPYAHFLLSMAMYAANVALVFYLFSLFLPLAYAFFGALFFGFHPTVTWIGRVCMQPYFVSLFCIALSLLFIKWGVESKKYRYVLLSSGVFFGALFFHEMTLIYPLWLIFVLPGFVAHTRKLAFFSRSVLVESLATWAPFVCATWFNLRFRAWTYPMSAGTESTLIEPGKILTHLKIRFFDFVTLLVDMLGLTWLPAGNRFRKGIVLMLAISILGWLFVRSTEKRKISVLLLAAFLFSWISVLMMHQPRYIYLGLPFFIGAILIAIHSVNLGSHAKRRLEWVTAFGAVALALIGAGHNYTHLKAFECKSIGRDNAHKWFLQQLDPIDKPVCFIGLPQEWFPTEGMAQAVWMYRGSSDIPVYHDWVMNMRCYQQPTLLDEAVLPQGDLLEIQVTGRTVHLKSKDPDKVWIRYKTPFGREIDCTMGTFKALVVDGEKALEATIEIDKKWYSDDLVFVTWDFETQRFKLVNTGCKSS